MNHKRFIPLVSLASEVFAADRPYDAQWFAAKDWPRLETNAPHENCYGVRIDANNASEKLKPGAIAVFSLSESESLHNLFCLGRKASAPLLCRFVKKESTARGDASAETVPASNVPDRRKSFMTPTPLHIPSSRQSPIADSIHQRMYFIPLHDPENMILVHPDRVLWMHPLVSIHAEDS